MTTTFLALLIAMALLAQVSLISFVGWRRQRARFLALGQPRGHTGIPSTRRRT
jgi:hypothetical protein